MRGYEKTTSINKRTRTLVLEKIPSQTRRDFYFIVVFGSELGLLLLLHQLWQWRPSGTYFFASEISAAGSPATAIFMLRLST